MRIFHFHAKSGNFWESFKKIMLFRPFSIALFGKNEDDSTSVNRLNRRETTLRKFFLGFSLFLVSFEFS